MKKILAVAALLLVSACQMSTPANKFPALTFEGGQAYKFNATSVEVVEEYKSPATAPNIEHAMPVSPMSGVKSWADSRLKASGKEGKVKVVVKDASVVETKLDKTTGVEGFFTRDQEAKYAAKLEATIQVFHGDALFPTSDANVKVERTRTVREDTTLAERDEFLYNLTKDLLNDFDKEMTKQIGTHLAKELN